jgi:hypothetical protein
MTMQRRLATVLTGLLLLPACIPGGMPAGVPATGSQPAAVTVPGGEPAAPAVAPATEPAPPALPRLTAQVVFPAGSLPMLKSTLRTLGTIDPRDLTLADLQRLRVALAGKAIAADRIQFSNLQWDSAGQITFSLTIDGVPFDAGQDLRITLPSRDLTLVGTAGQGAVTVEVSVRSTAMTMLKDAASQKGKADAEPSQDAVQVLAERLAKAVSTSAGTANPFANSDIVRVVDALAEAIAKGLPPQLQVHQINLGGGSGGSSPVVPAIASISPAAGPVGTTPTLTITGSNFASGATVSFGLTDAATVTVGGDDRITVVVPAGLAAGDYAVTVRNPSDQFVTRAAGYTVATPTITGISPVDGFNHASTAITISGQQFFAGATVKVGAIDAASVTVVDGTTITATVPAGLTPGAYDVAVTNPGGGSATLTNGFTATVITPTVTAVAPASGYRHLANTITITGQNFLPGATVRVGTTAATNVSLVDDTSLTATVPAMMTAGQYPVSVTNPGGNPGRLANAYEVTVLMPTISGVSPGNGYRHQNVVITIAGSNFVSGATVTVGGTPAGVVFDSVTQLRATLPKGLPQGANDVVVTNPGGGTATTTAAYDAQTITPAASATVTITDGPSAAVTLGSN